MEVGGGKSTCNRSSASISAPCCSASSSRRTPVRMKTRVLPRWSQKKAARDVNVGSEEPLGSEVPVVASRGAAKTPLRDHAARAERPARCVRDERAKHRLARRPRVVGMPPRRRAIRLRVPRLEPDTNHGQWHQLQRRRELSPTLPRMPCGRCSLRRKSGAAADERRKLFASRLRECTAHPARTSHCRVGYALP